MTEPSSSSSIYNNFIDNLEIPGDGAKKSLHGMDFQLKILMHVLWMAQKMGYKRFRLTTELPDAEKFDDVIFQYYEGDICKNRLIQIKHKDGKNLNALDRGALLSSNSSEPFAIFKYFESLISIEDRCKNGSIYSPFYNTEVKDVCLVTNSDLSAVNEDNKLEDLFSENEKSLEDDHLFRINDGHGAENSKNSAVKYTINGKSGLAQEIISISNMNSDFYNLVNALALDIVFEKKVTKSTKFLEVFKHSLKRKVLISDEIPEGFILKFTNNFIQGENLIEETKFLRTALLRQILLLQSQAMSADGIKDKTSQKSRKISQKHGKSSVLSAGYKKEPTEFKEIANEELSSDIISNVQLMISKKLYSEFRTEDSSTLEALEKFSRQLCSKFNPDGRCISIVKPQTENIEANDDWKVFEKNLHLLSKRHVIVSVFSKLRFSSRFIQGTHFDEDLLQFREKLMSDLREAPDFRIKEVLDLKNYTFNISIDDFRCSDEESILKSLPRPYTQDDFDNFFKKFKLIVKYPNRFEISNLLEKRMKKQLRSLDIDASKSIFQEKLFSWMSERMCTFYTPEKMKQLFDVLTKSLNFWQMEGVNQAYFAAVPKSYLFNTSRKLHCQFLDSDTEEMLCLCFEYLVLGRIRFFQTFRKLSLQNEEGFQEYTHMFGHIFLYASKLQDFDFRNQVSKALKDRNLWNLIVIDCDVEDMSAISKWLNEVRQLNKKRNTVRKFILIADEKSVKSVSWETKLVTTKVSDLEKLSLDKIYLEEYFYLQGFKIGVKELLRKNGLDYINAEILVKLIQGEKVEIGHEVHFSKGFDPSNYIDRVLETPDCKNFTISEQLIVKNPASFVLSCAAGMGKSTFLSSLSAGIRKFHPHIWVIRIDFNEYLSFFNKMLTNKDFDRQKLRENYNGASVDFLVELLMSNKKSKFNTQFEMKLLKAVLGNSEEKVDENAHDEPNKLQTALLFDGFDEISPTYNDLCLEFLKGMTKCKLAALIITTRPCFKKDLEVLNLGPSMRLTGFTDKQKYLLIKKLLLQRVFKVNSENYFSLGNEFYCTDPDILILFTYPVEMGMSRLHQFLTSHESFHAVVDCRLYQYFNSSPKKRLLNKVPSLSYRMNKKTNFDPFVPMKVKSVQSGGAQSQLTAAALNASNHTLTSLKKYDTEYSVEIDSQETNFKTNLLLTGFDDLIQNDQRLIFKDISLRSLNSHYRTMLLTNKRFGEENDFGKLSEEETNFKTLRIEVPAVLELTENLASRDLEKHINPLAFDLRFHDFLISQINFCFNTKNEFHTTPLFCEILTTSIVKRQNDSDTNSFLEYIISDAWYGFGDVNDFDLYANSIEYMHSILWHEKMRQDILNVVAQDERLHSFNSFVERYQKFAIYALYYSQKDCLKVMLSQFGRYEKVLGEIHGHLDRIEMGLEKRGLINGIIDGRPDFRHRSFAEFFVADFIGDVLKTNEIGEDFIKLFLNTAFDFPDRDNMEVFPSLYGIFNTEICHFFQDSLEKKAKSILTNISPYFEKLVLEENSDEYILKKKTFFAVLASYPELFKPLYDFFESKRVFDSMYDMYWDCVRNYVDHVFYLYTASDMNQHSFVLDNLNVIRKRFNISLLDPRVSHPTLSKSKEEFLMDYVTIANLSVPFDSALLIDSCIKKFKDQNISTTKVTLVAKRRLVKYWAFEFLNFYIYPKNKIKWTKKAFRAAFYAWSLEIENIFENSDFENDTLLHIASKRGYNQLLKWLIDQGFPINLSNSNGETPLDYLTSDRIAWLVQEGAIDNRCLTESKFVEKLKSMPIKCLDHLGVISSPKGICKFFDLALGFIDIFHNEPQQLQFLSRSEFKAFCGRKALRYKLYKCLINDVNIKNSSDEEFDVDSDEDLNQTIFDY